MNNSIYKSQISVFNIIGKFHNIIFFFCTEIWSMNNSIYKSQISRFQLKENQTSEIIRVNVYFCCRQNFLSNFIETSFSNLDIFSV